MKKIGKKAAVLALMLVFLVGGGVLAVAAEEKVKTIDAFIADEANWASSTKLTFKDGTVTTSPDSINGYKGSTLENELLEFEVKLTMNEQPWIYFGLGTHADQQVWIADVETYALFIHQDGTLSINRWQDGANAAEIITGVAATALIDGNFHRIQYGAIDTDAGVRLIVAVDGTRVIDVVDDSNDRIKGAKYLSFLNPGPSEAVLKQVGTSGATAEESAGTTDTAGEAAGSAAGNGTTGNGASVAESAPAASNPKTADAGIAGYALAAMLAVLAVAVFGRRQRVAAAGKSGR